MHLSIFHLHLTTLRLLIYRISRLLVEIEHNQLNRVQPRLPSTHTQTSLGLDTHSRLERIITNLTIHLITWIQTASGKFTLAP
jgi:hypothetical protein